MSRVVLTKEEQTYTEPWPFWPKRANKQKLFSNGVYWKVVRAKALEMYGPICMACGYDGPAPHVDHIKPKSKYPETAYDLSNLQILCRKCNFAKNTMHETDYRHKSP